MSEVIKDALALGVALISIGVLAAGIAFDSPAIAVLAVVIASTATVARVRALHAARRRQQETHPNQQDHLAAGS